MSVAQFLAVVKIPLNSCQIVLTYTAVHTKDEVAQSVAAGRSCKITINLFKKYVLFIYINIHLRFSVQTDYFGLVLFTLPCFSQH